MVAKCGKIDGTEALVGRCCVQAFWNGGFMLHTGDRVVHPLHGAGVIEGVVERMIDDEPVQYYVLRPAFGDTELFLPVNGCEKLGSARYEPATGGADSSRSWTALSAARARDGISATVKICSISVRASCVRLRRSSRAWPPGNAGAVCPRARKRCSHRHADTRVRAAFALECPAGEIAAQLQRASLPLSVHQTGRLCAGRAFFDFMICKEKRKNAD